MKKVSVVLQVAIDIEMEDGIDATSVLENMDYNFVSQTKGATIEDMEIVAWDNCFEDDGGEE
jgi:hypothetical protein